MRPGQHEQQPVRGDLVPGAPTLWVLSPSLPIQRPTWLPAYIPELQGLRGIAVLLVVIYHCHPRLEGTWLYSASLWGWTGVNLFFVLSGFLITSILLASRNQKNTFATSMAAARCASGLCMCSFCWFVTSTHRGSLACRYAKHSKPRRGGPIFFSCRICFTSPCRRPSAPPGRWRSKSSTTSSGRRSCACCAGHRRWLACSPSLSSPRRCSA